MRHIYSYRQNPSSKSKRRYIVDGKPVTHTELVRDNIDDVDFIEWLDGLRVGESKSWGGGAAGSFKIKRLEDGSNVLRRLRPKRSRRNPSEHRIYVANLAAYNAGRLRGKWIEPSTDGDELREQVLEAIGGNPDHEWAIHDYDSFPNMGEYPDLDDVAAMAEILEEHPYAIVKAAMSFVWNNDRQDIDSLKEWLDEGYGIYESKRDYVEQLVDDMGGPSKLDKQTIDSYFDYEAFGRDVLLDDIDEEDRERDRERYAGMSDSEVGESVIDDIYGDKIPADLADRYFDYDAYARDVFMDVASVRTPEGLVVFNAR